MKRPRTDTPEPTVGDTVRDACTWLERRGTQRNRDGMARYAIVSSKVYGVSVADVRQLAKSYRRDHALALALWDTGWHEARLLAAFVDDPALVTSQQMDRWAGDFDNWALCDTTCCHLFDRTPHAWNKVVRWSTRREEFVKRAAFALLAGVAQHDKAADDAPFFDALPLIERAADDDRNFVKKGVSWALREIGSRSIALHDASLSLARALSASDHASARWIGRDAMRDLTRDVVRKRLTVSTAGRRTQWRA